MLISLYEECVCVGVSVAGGGGTVYRVWECVCVGVCVAGGGGTI